MPLCHQSVLGVPGGLNFLPLLSNPDDKAGSLSGAP
jgi:hypothetical protein